MLHNEHHQYFAIHITILLFVHHMTAQAEVTLWVHPVASANNVCPSKELLSIRSAKKMIVGVPERRILLVARTHALEGPVLHVLIHFARVHGVLLLVVVTYLNESLVANCSQAALNEGTIVRVRALHHLFTFFHLYVRTTHLFCAH